MVILDSPYPSALTQGPINALVFRCQDSSGARLNACAPSEHDIPSLAPPPLN